MSRTRHPRPQRPSADVTRRVAGVLLEGEQRTIGALAAELGVNPEALRAAVRALGLRVVVEPVWRPEPRGRARLCKVEVVRG